MDNAFSKEFDPEAYSAIREGGSPWLSRGKKGLLAVSGGEALQFLNGLVTNDIGKLEEGGWMRAAFPNAKGRIAALVTVTLSGGRFVFTTEEATCESLKANLERFTFAGDFQLEDLTESMEVLTVSGGAAATTLREVLQIAPKKDGLTEAVFEGSPAFVSPAIAGLGFDVSVERELTDKLGSALVSSGAVEVKGPLAEVLRIEDGVPQFGVDVDEDTVVPEVALDGLISYNKGCYIGQEVIARIHFRGKVAKELKGVIFEAPEAVVRPGDELISEDGKNAGVITSETFSPKLGKRIALAFVRNAYLDPGTQLRQELQTCRVADLPFID